MIVILVFALLIWIWCLWHQLQIWIFNNLFFRIFKPFPKFCWAVWRRNRLEQPKWLQKKLIWRARLLPRRWSRPGYHLLPDQLTNRRLLQCRLQVTSEIQILESWRRAGEGQQSLWLNALKNLEIICDNSLFKHTSPTLLPRFFFAFLDELQLDHFTLWYLIFSNFYFVLIASFTRTLKS